MRIKISVLTLIVICLAAASFGSVQAQTMPAPSNITVRPFLQEIKINPGEVTKQFEVTINNDSKFRQVFSLATVNFGSLNETGGLAFEGASLKRISDKYGLAKWLKLERNKLELEAGQQAVVKAVIKNDVDMTPGAHYAAIIITAQKPIEAVDQLTITPKVSSLIFATKLGGEFYNIHLSSASHNGNLWKLPTAVNLKLQSTGNTYIIPRGVVSLKQGSQVISRGIINAQSAIVLPETVRSFDVELRRLIKPQTGRLFNDYTIQVDYRYDGIANFASKSYNHKTLNKITALLMLVLLSTALAVIVSLKQPRLRTKYGKLMKLLKKS